MTDIYKNSIILQCHVLTTALAVCNQTVELSEFTDSHISSNFKFYATKTISVSLAFRQKRVSNIRQNPLDTHTLDKMDLPKNEKQ